MLVLGSLRAALLSALSACSVASCCAIDWPPEDTAAQEQIWRTLAEDAEPAEVSVVLARFGTMPGVYVNADVVMHAASTMKLAVLLALMRADREGALPIDSKLTVFNRFSSAADGSEFVLAPDDDGETDLYAHVGDDLPVRELARRMITQSSNLATNILIARLTPEYVQETVANLGARATRIVRGVQDVKAFDAGIVNVTTARDLALLMSAIWLQSRDPGSDDTRFALEFLAGQKYNEMIPAGLPPIAPVLHKTGQITGIHHDAALVVLLLGPFSTPELSVLVVMTRGFDDPARSAEVGARIAHAFYDEVHAFGEPWMTPEQDDEFGPDYLLSFPWPDRDEGRLILKTAVSESRRED